MRFFSTRPEGPLRDYLEADNPGLRTPLNQLNLLAVDVETTGLNPKTDSLLSIGWVAVDGTGSPEAPAAKIRCGQTGHQLLLGASVGQSAVIHGLTDDALADKGVAVKQALSELLEQLKGRALLCHFSAIETQFLSAACREHFGAPLKIPVVIDTFAIERRHMERMGTYPRGEDLRLGKVRERYGLPNHRRRHNALSDALSCAELYLAQLAHSSARTAKQLANA